MTTQCELCEEVTATKLLFIRPQLHAKTCASCAEFALTDTDMVLWHGGKATAHDLDREHGND